MCIRITRSSYDPARYDEAIRLTQSQVIPALKQQPGFHSLHTGINREAATGITVSIWDTLDKAQASPRRGRPTRPSASGSSRPRSTNPRRASGGARPGVLPS